MTKSNAVDIVNNGYLCGLLTSQDLNNRLLLIEANGSYQQQLHNRLIAVENMIFRSFI